MRKLLLCNFITNQTATCVIFFITGFITAAWAAIIPYVKSNANLNDATLGLLILCFGLGAAISMPITGILALKFGCKKIIVISTSIFCIVLPILSTLSNGIFLVPFLFLFGVTIGLTDCAMNIQAVIVEKKAKKTIMSRFHGFYSIGGIGGAGMMSLILSITLSPILAVSIISIISLGLLFIGAKGFLNYTSSSSGPLIAIPKGVVFLIGIISFITFLSEGAVLDWSAIFLIEHYNLQESLGGLGFAIFSTTMTIGRLMGDKIVAHIGSSRVVFWGALIACFGFFIVVSSFHFAFAILGYAFVGIGCSNIVPIMFSAIGKQKTMPEELAVPAVSTLGYLGLLTSPAAIGFIAFQFNLSVALFCIVILLIIAAFISRFIKT